MRGTIAAWFCALMVVGSLPADAKNIALVIGNNAYQSVPVLAKAVGDARGMKAALAGLGFAVTEAENANYVEMTGLLAKLENQIEPGDVVVFHFSGHGVALGGDNFLLPVDVPTPAPGEEGMIRRLSFRADELISSFQAKGAR